MGKVADVVLSSYTIMNDEAIDLEQAIDSAVEEYNLDHLDLSLTTQVNQLLSEEEVVIPLHL